MVKKGLTALGLLPTQKILLFKHFIARITYHLRLIFCDALRDLIQFAQYKKREKHPSGIITFSNAWKYN